MKNVMFRILVSVCFFYSFVYAEITQNDIEFKIDKLIKQLDYEKDTTGRIKDKISPWPYKYIATSSDGEYIAVVSTKGLLGQGIGNNEINIYETNENKLISSFVAGANAVCIFLDKETLFVYGFGELGPPVWARVYNISGKLIKSLEEKFGHFKVIRSKDNKAIVLAQCGGVKKEGEQYINSDVSLIIFDNKGTELWRHRFLNEIVSNAPFGEIKMSDDGKVIEVKVTSKKKKDDVYYFDMRGRIIEPIK